MGSGHSTQWPRNVAMDQNAAMRPQRFNSFVRSFNGVLCSSLMTALLSLLW